MIRLPRDIVKTHDTAGLPGFPAVDVFGSPRDLVIADFWGKVTRISGKPPSQGGKPGGAYGRSIYVENAATGTVRYLTHFDELGVKVGDYVKPGRVLGTVCDSAVSGKPGTSHIHYGLKRGAPAT